MDGVLALLALFAFLGFTTQTATGFGGMIISLTLGALIAPIPELLPLLVPLSTIQGTIIAVRHRDKIDWSLLLKKILPLMVFGTAIGLAVFEWVEGPLLKRAFGGLVVLFASRELWRSKTLVEGEEVKPLPGILAGAGLLGAGITQGLYTTGGPLLVYVVGRLQLDKGTFRSSLAAVFALLNVGVLTTYVLQGRLTAEHLPKLAVLAPVLVVCLVVGEWLHGKIDEKRFRVVVFTLLLLAGGSLLLAS